MLVRLATTHYGVPGAMRSYTDAVRTALTTVGVLSEVRELPLAGARGRGGLLLPALRVATRRYPRGEFVHAVDHESAYRGTAVLTVHDVFLWERAPRLHSIPGRVEFLAGARRARSLVAVSEATRRQIGARWPRLAEKTHVVPTPFDTRVGPPHPKARDAIWVGRNDPQKGLPNFLAALADPALAGLRTRVRWTPAPDFPGLNEQVRALLRRRPDDESIERPVDYATLLEWMAESRCIVSTSTQEGLHSVMMEAYIRRTRVVAPRIPPYTEFYPEGAAGVHWYSSGSQEQLVGAIRAAVDAPELFTPDAGVLARISYSTVGAALRQIYLKAGWTESGGRS